jgi:hypothetical protein
MLVSVNGIDITEHISPKSYKVNAEKIYGGSWQDGNFREHRVFVRDKVSGSFDIALYGRDGMTTQAFLQNWEAATNENVVTLLVYVQNKNIMQAITAYFEFKGKKHRELNNGEYLDIITVEIEEQ